MPKSLGPLAALVGPTASGKSEMAIEVARSLENCEIVYCDSMAVYRGFDIAADKPSDTLGVPHHMIDVAEANETFNAGEYRELGRAAISEVHSRGALPLVVGGTGLWFRALVDDLNLVDSNHEIRNKLEGESTNDLFQKLSDCDPQSAERIGRTNRRRIIRAIEIFQITSTKASERTEWSDYASIYDLRVFALTWNRDELIDRATKRVHDEISAGLIEEVKSVLARTGVSPTARQMLGVKEMIPLIEGTHSREEATETLVRNTKRFLRRQISWFSADPRIVWVNVSELGHSRARDMIVAGFAELKAAHS